MVTCCELRRKRCWIIIYIHFELISSSAVFLFCLSLQVPRLVRMHSDEMQDITEVGAGDVVAMFGVDCSSMDSFTDGTVNLAMTSMFIPNPVMSLAVRPKDSGMVDKFGKALAR